LQKSNNNQDPAELGSSISLLTLKLVVSAQPIYLPVILYFLSGQFEPVCFRLQENKKSEGHTNALFAKLLNCCKTLLKSINASAGINELLLTSEEGVALGANFYIHIALNGMGNNSLATSALNGSNLVLGMNSGFHFNTS